MRAEGEWPGNGSFMDFQVAAEEQGATTSCQEPVQAGLIADVSQAVDYESVTLLGDGDVYSLDRTTCVSREIALLLQCSANAPNVVVTPGLQGD